MLAATKPREVPTGPAAHAQLLGKDGVKVSSIRTRAVGRRRFSGPMAGWRSKRQRPRTVRDSRPSLQLANHVRVTAAKLQNGLLSIDLQRELPGEKKPRRIPIEAQAAARTITHQ